MQLNYSVSKVHLSGAVAVQTDLEPSQAYVFIFQGRQLFSWDRPVLFKCNSWRY